MSCTATPAFAAVIGLAILVICMWANSVGALVPLLARRFGIDPAVVSAPLISTLVDATGLVIFYTVAIVLLIKMAGTGNVRDPDRADHRSPITGPDHELAYSRPSRRDDAHRGRRRNQWRSIACAWYVSPTMRITTIAA